MKFKLGISQRIFLSYSSLIVLCALLSVFCYNMLINTKESSNYISEVVDPSLKAMDDFELLVVESKMLTTNWVFLRSKEDDKKALKRLHAIHFPELKSRLKVLAQHWNNKPLADSLHNTIADFESLILDQKNVTQKLLSFEDYDDPAQKLDAESLLEETVLPKTALLMDKVHYIINSQKVQKANLQNAINDMSGYMRNLVISVLALFVLVSLILGFYMSNIITKPIITIKDGINALGLGKLAEIKSSRRNDEIGEMINSVNHLVNNLRQTTEFANNIGKGNFTAEHTPLSKHDELGAALIDMKLNLTKFNAEERDRNWTNQGLNEVGDILRDNQDSVMKLSDKVLQHMVGYTHSIQGVFYRLHTEEGKEPYLKFLIASNNFTNHDTAKEIPLGYGTIGQVALKQQHAIIPVDDVEIEGEKVKQLVYTPLVFEGELMGVIELAARIEFTDLHTDWVYKVASMTASTCDIIKRKQTTEHLLKEARKLNTELIVKEDALRQANQKMQEKAIELEKQNEAIRTKNESLEIAREAIRVKAEELEKANKYKSEFLANMSHELRTPLNSIIILSNLLSENKGHNLTNKQVEYAKVIQKSGNDLLELINDILDISKIESNHMELDLQEVNIKDWANDIQMLFSEVAKNKGIRFTVAMDKSIPDLIETDRMRLSQVIKNLLSNAFKFTDAKGVVSLRVTKDLTGNHSTESLNGKDVLCFEVADSGIGIPEEKQQLIFEPFRQADGSTSRKFGGTGLGLSISKELANLLGGVMTLESTVGKGSTFRLFIPLQIDELPVAASQLASPVFSVSPAIEQQKLTMVPAVVVTEADKAVVDNSTLNLAAYKILVVDDDMRNIFSLTSILDDYKPQIVIANNGQEALDKLQEHTDIDLVLMDIMMPIMDGYEAMKRIRKDLKLTHLPIISVTANAMVGDDEICKRAGASDYLPKPVSKKVLIECIAKWLNLNRAVAV